MFATCASMSLAEKYRPVAASTSGASRPPMVENVPPSPLNATTRTAARQHARATATAARARTLVGVDREPRSTNPVIATSRGLTRANGDEPARGGGGRAGDFDATAPPRHKAVSAS